MAGALGAGEDPVAVTALVAFDVAADHFPGVGGDGVEEPAVVGHHDQRAAAAQQVLGQPLHALHVEMVGRLVQYQQVELAHQRRGERDPPPLAAGEIVDRGVHAETGDADAVHHRADARVGGPFVFGDLVGHRVVGEAGQHHRAHRRARGQRAALGHHRRAQAAEPADPAAVGFLDPGEHLEQGGFAASVEADDPDPFADMHAERDVVQQRLDPEALMDLFEIDQVGHESFRVLRKRADDGPGPAYRPAWAGFPPGEPGACGTNIVRLDSLGTNNVRSK